MSYYLATESVYKAWNIVPKKCFNIPKSKIRARLREVFEEARPENRDKLNHFDKRCLERVGYLLDYKELSHKIHNNILPIIKKESDGIIQYSIELEYRKYRLIVKDIKTELVLVTIIPY